ncbi:hypothetical protein PUN28_006651 [Cardiocondyla obscurior]|uniref:Uncharacterized protein n=1 Tax=Cardiocondyla obscurior TaxID=286306 RepID=A0AAW2GBL9_9HYME
MVKINTRWKTAEDLKLLRGTPTWTKVKYFWRKGWVEIPGIMASSSFLLVGTALSIYTMYYGLTHDLTPKYYETHRIYRPDDPAVKKIRHTSVYDY